MNVSTRAIAAEVPRRIVGVGNRPASVVATHHCNLIAGISRIRAESHTVAVRIKNIVLRRGAARVSCKTVELVVAESLCSRSGACDVGDAARVVTGERRGIVQLRFGMP